MSSLVIALIVLGCILGSTLFGSLLRSFLPEHHLRDDSKDVMKTAAGMMATLSALIIGLLVSSAKSSYDTTSARLTEGGAKMITLDRILLRYGTETKGIRELLQRSVAAGIERIWPSESSRKSDLAGVVAATGMEDVYDKIRELAPQNETQQYLKGQALQLSSDLMQSRWMLIEQSQNSLPTIFLVVLVFWLSVLFGSFGLLAPRNLTAVSALIISAVSMAGAIFLILELNHPLEGSIKASSAPLQKALAIISK